MATQSLWFLNDDQIIGLTGGLADRLFTNNPIKADQRLDALFRKLFATAPTDEEKRYYPASSAQEELFRADRMLRAKENQGPAGCPGQARARRTGPSAHGVQPLFVHRLIR